MSEGRGALVAGFLASVVAVAAAYASAFPPGGPPGWAPWLMVGGVAGSLVSVMALGAWRDGSVGPLTPVFAFVFVVLVGGFGAALQLPGGADGAGGLWLGLPPGAAVVLYGVGLLPLFVVPVAYALSFDRFTLDEEDWERVRSARRRASPSPAEGRGSEGAGPAPAGRGRG